ncbi:MAG TPA: hypothetical protein PLB21_00655 [Actinomycetota bacterium]|nr:hypothetical protein [Actinomycetota bacterium]
MRKETRGLAFRGRGNLATGLFVAGILALLVVACGCSVVPPEPNSAQPTAGPPWPGPDNTGVPDGTQLSSFTGDCIIKQPGAVIDAKIVNCNLRIRAQDVKITRSIINGNVSVPSASSGFSFAISDSEVNTGANLNTGLGNANYTAIRVEVTGGRRSAYCERNCTIEYSWIHGQAGDATGQAHLSGVRMSQDTTIRGNTLVCDAPRIPPGSGCSAALTGYGGFAPVQNNLIEGNIFYGGTASHCAYGGSSESKEFASETNHIRFVDNVFVRGDSGKCGSLGSIASFDPDAPGNEWSGNTWLGGEPFPAP